MNASARCGVLLLALASSGCAHFWMWDPPPERQRIEAGERAEHSAPGSLSGESEYRVRRGDTLYSIAFRSSLDFRELAQWNGIGSDYLIVPGQRLRLTPPEPGAQGGIVTGDVTSRPTAIEFPPPSAPRPLSAERPPLPDPPPTVFSWRWPVDAPIARAFALDQGSKGLDFAGRAGQTVSAAAPGRVVYSGDALKGYGELIIIKHDEAYLSAYGFNRKRLVSEGDVVIAGQPIAEMGNGPENKPLLHFEIRERGKPVNPARFLPKK